MPLLKCINAEQAGAFFDLVQSGVIGREPSNVYCLDQETISRRHAEVLISGDGVELRDLGSANGTYVNGRRIDDRANLLSHGDQIYVGAMLFEYREQSSIEDDDTLDRPMIGRGSRSITVAAGSLLDKQTALARSAQRRLVMSDPAPVPGYKIAHHFEPATGVGGDFAIQHPLPDGRLLLVLGDVCGKGLPASVYMAYVCGVLAGLDPELPPTALMKGLNRALVEVLEPGMFVTAQALCLDPDNHRADVISAGHHPPMLVADDGKARQLSFDTGLALGLTHDITLGGTRVELKSREILIFSSDGLDEAVGSDGDYLGVHRCVEAATGAAGALDAVRRLSRLVDGHVGNADASDDLTLLAIERAES